MPRIKNGMPYEVYRSPIKGDDGNEIVFVRPQSERKVTMKETDDYCAEHYALRPGELTRAFEAFIQATGYYLSRGYRLETPIGSFVPKLGLRRTITNPDEVRNQDVCFEGIGYRSSKMFEERVSRWLEGFQRVKTPDTQKLLADTAHLDEVLQQCLTAKGYVTVSQFAFSAELTKYSARKQLEAWCQGERPRLMKTQWGKQHI